MFFFVFYALFTLFSLNLQSDSQFFVHNSTGRRVLPRKWQGCLRRAEWGKTHEAGNGWEERPDIEGVYSDASSLHSKLRTLGKFSRRWRNGRCPWDVIICISLFWLILPQLVERFSRLRWTIFISAWASKLLIFTEGQVRRPGVWDK